MSLSRTLPSASMALPMALPMAMPNPNRLELQEAQLPARAAAARDNPCHVRSAPPPRRGVVVALWQGL